MLLEARTITKSFDDTPVLRSVTFGADEGEIVSLLGPSGCGKSTLLRIVAGLEQSYSGTVHFEGRAIDAVPVHRRGFGLMFQDFALFPHRSVAQNIAFGPRMQGLKRAEVERRVDEALELVGLSGFGGRTVFELSGGERQRVALARALAPRPRLLLLDEPLGALDRTLREHLTDELREIIKRAGTTSVYVTHDQVEAFAVADRVSLMNRGVIVQSGTPAEVYTRPASPFAARFLGLNNLVEAQATATNDAGSTVVETVIGPLEVAQDQSVPSGEALFVLIRPEAAIAAPHSAVNPVRGIVVRRAFRGANERILLRHASGVELELDIEAGALPEHGEAQLGLRPNALALISGDGAS